MPRLADAQCTGTLGAEDVLVTMAGKIFGAIKDAAKAIQTDDEAICRSFFTDVWVHGKVDMLDQYAAKNFSTNAPPGYDGNLKGYRRMVEEFHAAFKVNEGHLEEVVEHNGRVAMHWNLDATQRAEWMGIPSTGKSVHMDGITISTVRDGRVAHEHTIQDMLPVLGALGVKDISKFGQ